MKFLPLCNTYSTHTADASQSPKVQAIMCFATGTHIV
jgi:hypothetical protein